MNNKLIAAIKTVELILLVILGIIALAVINAEVLTGWETIAFSAVSVAILVGLGREVLRGAWS